MAKKTAGGKYHVKLTFVEPLLGTVPKDPKVFETYIAGLSPNVEETLGEELETVPKASEEEKRWTGFHTTEDGKPFLYDYAIKGFFKDCCSMLSRATGTESGELKAFKKVIDGLVFVRPRKIPIVLAGELFRLERPLRAQTAQGERVALSRSDAAPIGSSIEFDVNILGGVSEVLLSEWLDYGANRGIGQWRNGGYGSFEYELVKL